MAKVVINTCYGGFGLSEGAIRRYLELKQFNYTVKERFGYPEFTLEDGILFYPEYERDDPILVQVVEEFGERANGGGSDLQIVEVPEGVSYRIHEYDGMESIEYRDDINWSVG